MDRARPRHLAPLTLGIALALGAGAMPDAAAAIAAGLHRQSGGIVLRQQLHALMPAESKAPAASASLRVVTSCADDGSAGTLRTVVAAAGEGDTVDLSTLKCSTITLTQGAIPVLLNDLTMVGPGSDALVIDAAGSDRVLVHPGYGTLTLTALTVRNGATRVSGFHITGGGCIASAGYLVLDHSQVRSCFASGEGVYGGGIFAYTVTMYTSVLSGAVALGSNPDTGTAAFGGGAYTAYVTLVDSTVNGNRAAHDLNDGHSGYDTGGGIFTNFGGSIRSSTIDHNYSYGFGGGLSAFNGVINIANSTISGNTARTRGGGGLNLRVFYGETISNSTITANTAPAGGGVYLRGVPDQFELQSTLIAGNTATAGSAADFGSESPTALLGNDNLVSIAGANVTLPVDTLHAAPLLRPLADNGGPTRTHALMPGSPAIDAGNNFPSLEFDQRGPGFPRVLGPAADIGAFEGVVADRPPVPAPAASAPVLVLLGAALAWLGIRRGRVRRSRFARIFTYLSPRRGHSSQT
ncbi:MAG TPA: right-handed parallel beta-helix repeat-containing protein [Rudaea sp.]|nr:right-handed parallel beta-helix repeat-containing protein [Rudaea sp.]